MGLLDILLGPQNPGAQFADTNRNWLAGVGAGLASGTNLGQSFADAAQFGLQGKQADYQQNLLQNQYNQTAQFLKENGRPDLATLALGGQGAAALQQYFNTKQPGYGQLVRQPGDWVTDTQTGTTTQIPRNPIPVGYGVQGFLMPDGSVQSVTPGGGSQASLGITGDGSPNIDASNPDYAVKPIPGINMTNAALDQSTLNYLATGQMPRTGMGPQGQIIRTAIMNHAAQLDPTGNLASNKAQTAALSHSLGQQVSYLNNTQRAFNTANDTLASLQQYMADNHINPAQYPDANTWGNAIQSHGPLAGIIGGYNAQLETIRKEYSIVLSKGGPRSDATDRAAALLIPDGLPPNQLAQVAERIKVDAQNAVSDAQKQVASVNDQIGKVAGVNYSQVPPPTGGGAAPSSASTGGLKGTTSTGINFSFTPG